MLSTYLAKIDERVTTDKPHVAKGLRPGADENDLTVLRQTIFEPAEVPEDLATFFRWHNGQSGYQALSSLDNRMLMSIDDAIDTYSFLSSPDEDIQQPWQDNWLPILANGGGDYVVYVTSGVMKGQLIFYWHTDNDRRLAFESLQSWAEKVLESYAGME